MSRSNSSRRLLLSAIGIIAGTTIGAGIFTLPTVFERSGWGTSLYYLLVLSSVMAFAHYGYYRVLSRTGHDTGLLGLVRKHLGSSYAMAGFLAIIFGNILTLAFYLKLGSAFLITLLPNLDPWPAAIILWFVSALPIFFGIRRFARLEVLATILLVATILLISSLAPGLDFRGQDLVTSEFFLPFGALLFALAGWTAVEPVYELRRGLPNSRFSPVWAFVLSALVIALLYVLFSAAVLSFGPDASSLQIALAICGLAAIWTSYVPLGREAERSLTAGAGSSEGVAALTVGILPIVLFALIDNLDILKVVGLIGGIFLAAQYVLLVLVVRAVLKPRSGSALLYDLIAVLFALAAVYELYYFVLG